MPFRTRQHFRKEPASVGGPYRKQHHLQGTISHCGVFNGKRWIRQIDQQLRDFIHAFDEQNAADFSTAKLSFSRTRHHDEQTQGNFEH
jgi:hypothetical protein